MTRVDVPVHVEEVSGIPVRFFRSPRFAKTGMPDMPWHSCDDLWSALGIDESVRSKIMQGLRGGWADPLTVATPDGIAVIVPFVMGDTLLDEWLRLQGVNEDDEREDSLVLRRIRGAFRRGNSSALKAMTSHLDARARLAFSLAAMDAIKDPEAKE